MAAHRRLLLVHAHPDDETINNGATMARYAAAGAQVVLLTCTLGELGEILVPRLRELEWDRGDQLGGYRMLELARAMTALGVTDHRFLGGPGRFHDSGMLGTPGNHAPRAFWRAATDPGVFAAAVGAAVAVVRQVRPQVVVTYDENGGYGHPDHVMAHRVTMAAIAAAADPAYDAADPAYDAADPAYDAADTAYDAADPAYDAADTDAGTSEAEATGTEAEATGPDGEATGPGEPWSVSKVYWNVLPRSSLQRGLTALRQARTGFVGVDSVDDFPFAADDGAVTTVIDAGAYRAAKTAGMRAHATQISVDEPFFALSNNLGLLISGTEHYRLASGVLGRPLDADGHETDLFAGIS